jgi:hypothetical protein
MTKKGCPSFIYKNKKGNEFYRADWHPEKLPPFHKRLMQFHIFYLFVLPSVAIFLNDMYYVAHVAFRRIGWLILAMYVGFLINNYRILVSKKKAVWEVFAVPVQILIVSLVFQWGWVLR